MLWFRKKKKPARPLCGAVIAAAGSSSRMGADKILLPLGEDPVIVHTLRAFEAAKEISEIVVVTRQDLIVPVAQLCRDCGFAKVAKVIAGGGTRTQSVRLGILELASDPELIAIHDGARPFVTGEIIRRTVDAARKCGAAAPAVPLSDTVKELDANGLAVRTVDRETLRAVQTPQIFQEGLIRAALQKALEDGAALTDDCAAVERLGMKVMLVPGSEENLKLTTPADLLAARAILEAREL